VSTETPPSTPEELSTSEDHPGDGLNAGPDEGATVTPKPRLTVIGTGYLGAVHAACMAEIGYDVLGVDVDAAKVAALTEGRAPFFEPGLEPLLRKNIDAGRLRFTSSFEEAAAFGDVHFICVGTPQKSGSFAADLTYVEGAADQLARHLDRPALVVGKSTVPVGTAALLRERIRATAPAGTQVDLVWNPEFLREGYAVDDTLRPDRLVIGTDTPGGEALLASVYQPLLDDGVPLVVTDFPTAELVKVAANSFLATKISFINAMAEVCEAASGDVVALAKALSYDDRIGGRFLHAGLGFGGGCLPKDIRAFMARAGELGADQALVFLKNVDEINMRRRARMIDLVRETLGGSLIGRRVAVLGATFKPNTDDVRDSPALNVAATLQLSGAQVRIYDPEGMDNARRLFPTLTFAGSTTEAVTAAEVVVVLTEWTEFREMGPDALAEVVDARHIVDGRNALDPEVWREAGWTYRALGRP
jgi:UDPglucose 6-dehydrogenase